MDLRGEKPGDARPQWRLGQEHAEARRCHYRHWVSIQERSQDFASQEDRALEWQGTARSIETGAGSGPVQPGRRNLRGCRMNFKMGTPIFLLAGLLAVCGPLWAHHGNSAYDEEHWITITGSVTEFIWANPHCQIFLDVKDDKGAVSHWAIESQSPGILRRNNWTRTSVKAGDQIA